MRLVIDLQCLQSQSKYRGIGRYGRSLARALLRNKGSHDVWIALRNGADRDIADLRAEFSDLLPPGRLRVFSLFDDIAYISPANDWRRQISEHVWAYALSLLRPDFVLCPSLIEGFDDGIATTARPMAQYAHCAIVHDLIPYHDPGSHIGWERAQKWYLEKLSHLTGCDLLLCNSEYTRSDVLKSLDFPADRIASISSGGDFEPAALGAGACAGGDPIERFGLTNGYFLAVGAIEPRKNAQALLHAFASLPGLHRQGKKIVFAGIFKEPDAKRLTALAESLKLDVKTQVVLAGFVPDGDLLTLYRHCSAFIFPSFAEGFGLPVLEAMRAGAPVLASNRTSLPEIVGRADVLFDPDDPAALRDLMVGLLENPERRAELVAHGLAQAETFSWDRTAGKALQLMEQRLVQRPRIHPELAGRERYFDYVRSAQAMSEILDRHHVNESGRRAAASLLHANINVVSDLLGAEPIPALRWRVEGPFDSSYSLALVNRETARGLERLGVDVSLFSTEGPGDFDPDPRFLERMPGIARIYEKGRDAEEAFGVVSRILYPPRVTRMNGAINLLHHYAWEESGFPEPWIEDFNAGLNGFSCLSAHVRKVMTDHGLRLPMAVTGNGVDHWDAVQPAADFRLPAKSYRFLHVSSCFPRKGVDCLLAAYGKAFRRTDDVSLIIKTTPNSHNTVVADIARLKCADPDFPDVIVLDRDFSDSEMKALYGQCHALVAPSRAEGFCLPAAEAMLNGLPVIVTGWSGAREFCNHQTAWLIDYDFGRAHTHFDLPASVWAEPKADHLAGLLKDVRGASKAEIKRKTDAGAALLRGRFTWNHAAWRLQAYVSALPAFAKTAMPAMKIGWVSTWGVRCGIATYSRYLLNGRGDVAIFADKADGIEGADEAQVIRNWTSSRGSLHSLASGITQAGCNVVVIQYNYAFFVTRELTKLLERLLDDGRIVVIEIHATHERDPDGTRRLAHFKALLQRCARVLVHSIADMNRLKQMGVEDNVTLFPHAYITHRAATILPSPLRQQLSGRSVIASYGFFLPNKGLMELIEGFGTLVRDGLNGHLLLINAEYPVDVSRQTIERCERRIADLGLSGRVTLITGFLPDEESLSHMQLADLIVLPYQQSTTDSASGAVRLCLVSGRPVAVTPLPIFDDVQGAVLNLPGFSAAEVASGIGRLIGEVKAKTPLIRATADRARKLVETLSYAKLSKRLFGMLESLHISRVFDEFCAGNPPQRIGFRQGQKTFEPREGQLRTQVGKVDSHGVLQTTGRQGVFSFGPYVPLVQGRYRLRALGRNGAGEAHLRVVSEQGRNVLHECAVDSHSHTEDDCILDTEFALDHFHADVEFVVTVSAKTELGLRAYLLDECRV